MSQQDNQSFVFHNSSCQQFYQISDCHLLAAQDGWYQQIQPYYQLQRLLSALSAQPKPLLLTGDLTQDHSRDSYLLLAALLANWPEPVFYLPGNHDEPALMAEVFAQAPFQSATRLLCAGWELLLLNTKGETPAGVFPVQRQQQLQLQLQSATGAVWLFCHHHPLPIGSSIDEHGQQNSAALLQLLAAQPQVKGLAHGHCHYAYQRWQDHWQIVGCPASSVQFKLGPQWQTEDLGPQAILWSFFADQQVQWEFLQF